MLDRGLGKHPQKKSPCISVSDLLSSAICRIIAVMSLLVAIEALPDDMLVLPNASGIVLAWTV